MHKDGSEYLLNTKPNLFPDGLHIIQQFPFLIYKQTKIH